MPLIMQYTATNNTVYLTTIPNETEWCVVYVPCSTSFWKFLMPIYYAKHSIDLTSLINTLGIMLLNFSSYKQTTTKNIS